MKIECFGTGSTGNCYLVKMGSRNILLDAGVKLEKVIKSVDMNDIDFCFISHSHQDHSKYRQKLEKRGVLILDGAVNREMYENRKIAKFCGNYRTWVVPLDHGKTACGALIVKNTETNELILYATDFSICRTKLYDWKFTSIIVECNYIEPFMKEAIETAPDEMIVGKYKRQFNTHMGMLGLEKFLSTLDLKYCKEIILVHQSRDTRISNQNEMGLYIYSAFKKPVGVCQPDGGIEWFGKLGG